MNPGQIANFSTATIETSQALLPSSVSEEISGNLQLSHPGKLPSENKDDLNKPQYTVDSCSGLPKSLLIF